MAFEINHAAAFNIVPEGEYEFIITACGISTTRGGTEYIDIQLTVRNDVAQHGCNRVVYSPIWRAKQPEPKDAACDGFMANQINRISRAADLTNGKSYGSINEWCADLVGKPLRATVYHDEYNGQTNARVRNMNKTNFPDVQHRGPVYGAATAPAAAPAPAADDDCPF